MLDELRFNEKGELGGDREKGDVERYCFFFIIEVYGLFYLEWMLYLSGSIMF